MSEEKEVYDIPEKEMDPPEIESWMKYSWEMRQKTPERIEDAAKFLATMISIALSFFLGLLRLETTLKQIPFIKVVPVIWLFSLMVALYVLYPKEYRYSADSAESIKKMTEAIIEKKLIRLFWAIVLFVVGFMVFGGAVLIPL